MTWCLSSLFLVRQNSCLLWIEYYIRTGETFRDIINLFLNVYPFHYALLTKISEKCISYQIPVSVTGNTIRDNLLEYVMEKNIQIWFIWSPLKLGVNANFGPSYRRITMFTYYTLEAIKDAEQKVRKMLLLKILYNKVKLQ